MFVNLVGFWCCSSVGCRFLISFLGFGDLVTMLAILGYMAMFACLSSSLGHFGDFGWMPVSFAFRLVWIGVILFVFCVVSGDGLWV